MDIRKDNKLPPTSPPATPEPPTPRFLSNTPQMPVVTPHLTPEEEQAALDEEMAAREQDMVEAIAEEEASIAAMEALEGAFVPNGIFRHRGVGPIKYETKRGLISMFPGDLACHVIGPVQPIPDPPPAPEDLVTDDDWIIVSEAVLSALLFTLDYKLFPDTLEYRAARIGEARRAAAAAPPPPEADTEILSDEELSKLSEKEREDYSQKRKDALARKQRGPGGERFPTPKPPAKPTQLPANAPAATVKGEGYDPNAFKK